MVWQDVFPNFGPKLDADREQERRLVEQARAGADWALAALVARYQPPVTRYLTRLTGKPRQASKLAEMVFTRMERRLHGPQGSRQLRLWLLRACTEAGLEALRGPRASERPRLLASRRPAALLPGQNSSTATFFRTGFEKLATVTGSTSRQVRKLIWSNASTDQSMSLAASRHADTAYEQSNQPDDAEHDTLSQSAEDLLDPRDVLRHRMVRAVLAELPYGDAQCLALHLVAGLNQAEVAVALGITASATRRRIVHGLSLFAQRYEAAAASLGLPADFYDRQATEPQYGESLDEREAAMLSTIHDGNEAYEFDTLSTNEHIAVHPLASDDAILIWSGQIYRDSHEQSDVSPHTPANVEPTVVEASLAHVSEPVEMPGAVEALSERDMREEHVSHPHDEYVALSADEALDTPAHEIAWGDFTDDDSASQYVTSEDAVAFEVVESVTPPLEEATPSDAGSMATLPAQDIVWEITPRVREIPVLTPGEQATPTLVLEPEGLRANAKEQVDDTSGPAEPHARQTIRVVPTLTSQPVMPVTRAWSVKEARTVPVLTKPSADDEPALVLVTTPEAKDVR